MKREMECDLRREMKCEMKRGVERGDGFKASRASQSWKERIFFHMRAP
jgi:hypothetical protein